MIKPVVLFVGEAHHLRRGKDRIVYTELIRLDQVNITVESVTPEHISLLV